MARKGRVKIRRKAKRRARRRAHEKERSREEGVKGGVDAKSCYTKERIVKVWMQRECREKRRERQTEFNEKRDKCNREN